MRLLRSSTCGPSWRALLLSPRNSTGDELNIDRGSHDHRYQRKGCRNNDTNAGMPDSNVAAALQVN